MCIMTACRALTLSEGGIASESACFTRLGRAVRACLDREHARTGTWLPVVRYIKTACLTCPNRLAEGGVCGCVLQYKDTAARVVEDTGGRAVIALVEVVSCPACRARNAACGRRAHQLYFRVLDHGMMPHCRYTEAVYEALLEDPDATHLPFEEGYLRGLYAAMTADCGFFCHHVQTVIRRPVSRTGPLRYVRACLSETEAGGFLTKLFSILADGMTGETAVY